MSYKNITYIVFTALRSSSSSSVELLRLWLLMVLDGKPLPAFGGVNQEGYHAQSHPAALLDKQRKVTNEPCEMQRK